MELTVVFLDLEQGFVVSGVNLMSRPPVLTLLAMTASATIVLGIPGFEHNTLLA